MSDLILAVDLGKYKGVACLDHRATAAAGYRTLTTSRAEVERRIRSTRPAVVVIEACTLAGWVSDRCGELGVPSTVANTSTPAGDREGRSWRVKGGAGRDLSPAS